MKKHFRKRVSNFSEDYYVVQYAYYNIFPIWHTLNFWFEQTLLGGTEGWTTNLWGYKEAVSVAESLKSIEDVKAYYAPMEERERVFYRNKQAYLKERVPYMQKEIL